VEEELGILLSPGVYYSLYSGRGGGDLEVHKVILSRKCGCTREYYNDYAISVYMPTEYICKLAKKGGLVITTLKYNV
jgi:hypothetical protein